MTARFDLAIERAYVGAVFMRGEVECDIAPDALTSRTLQAVFEELKNIIEGGELPSSELLLVALTRRGMTSANALEVIEEVRCSTLSGGDVSALATRLDELARERRKEAARLDAVRELQAGNLDAAREAIARAEASHAPRIQSCWVSDWGDDVMGGEPPRRTFLLHRHEGDASFGWLPLSEIALLVAHGGIGKSTALTQLALSVATGSRLFGSLVPTIPGPVAILSLEDDANELLRRLHWACVAAWLNEEDRALAASRIRIITPPRDAVLVAPDERGVPREQPVLAEILRDLRAANVEWRAVILDPLNRLHACDENANGAMGHVIASIGRFLELPGRPAVLIAHHSAKGKEGAASRGATAIINAARWCASLEPTEEHDGIKLTVTKSNYTRKGSPILLTRDLRTRGALRAMTIEEETSA